MKKIKMVRMPTKSNSDFVNLAAIRLAAARARATREIPDPVSTAAWARKTAEAILLAPKRRP